MIKVFADFILVSVDAGANANFGILNSDGSKQAIINKLKGQVQILFSIRFQLIKMKLYSYKLKNIIKWTVNELYDEM